MNRFRRVAVVSGVAVFLVVSPAMCSSGSRPFQLKQPAADAVAGIAPELLTHILDVSRQVGVPWSIVAAGASVATRFGVVSPFDSTERKVTLPAPDPPIVNTADPNNFGQGAWLLLGGGERQQMFAAADMYAAKLAEQFVSQPGLSDWARKIQDPFTADALPVWVAALKSMPVRFEPVALGDPCAVTVTATVEQQIRAAFACAAQPRLVPGGLPVVVKTRDGDLVGQQAVDRLVDEALAVAWMWSRFGEAPCSVSARAAGVFPAPPGEVGEPGVDGLFVDQRCDPVKNVKWAAQTLIDGSAAQWPPGEGWSHLPAVFGVADRFLSAGWVRGVDGPCAAGVLAAAAQTSGFASIPDGGETFELFDEIWGNSTVDAAGESIPECAEWKAAPQVWMSSVADLLTRNGVVAAQPGSPPPAVDTQRPWVTADTAVLLWWLQQVPHQVSAVLGSTSLVERLSNPPVVAVLPPESKMGATTGSGAMSEQTSAQYASLVMNQAAQFSGVCAQAAVPSGVASTSTGDVTQPSGRRALPAVQVAAVAYAAGWRGDDLVMAVAVADAESSFIPDNIHVNRASEGYGGCGAYSEDWGLWQVNNRCWDKLIAKYGGNWKDPATNAKMAYEIWASTHNQSKGGWGQWVTFNIGAQNAHLSVARAAVDALMANPAAYNVTLSVAPVGPPSPTAANPVVMFGDQTLNKVRVPLTNQIAGVKITATPNIAPAAMITSVGVPPAATRVVYVWDITNSTPADLNAMYATLEQFVTTNNSTETWVLEPFAGTATKPAVVAKLGEIAGKHPNLHVITNSVSDVLTTPNQTTIATSIASALNSGTATPTQPVSCLTGAAPGAGGGETAPFNATPRPATSPDGPIQIVDIPATASGHITVNLTIAGNVTAMFQAAQTAGITFGGGGYRDPQAQIAVRKANGCPDIYNSPATACHPPTARPGKSMHERGLAMDLTCNGEKHSIGSHSSPCWIWLNNNAARFGLQNLPSEPWHWSTNGR